MPRLTSLCAALLLAALLCVSHGAAGEAAAVPLKAPAAPAAGVPAGASAPAATPASAAVAARVDADVALFNPDIYRLDENGIPVHGGRSLFLEPATEVARQVLSATWFTTFVFLPFLILPLVLLAVVIVKFRDRGDGRAPSTTVGNHKLEVIWTAIPFLAVLIVSIPTYYVLDFMDAPPKETRDLQVMTVTGKQFAWMYEYKRYYKDPNADEKECLQTSLDPVNQLQEPLLLTKGRSVSFNLTSQDVTHGWWVPAFGVKKSAIIGRFTNVWFTPDTLGVFKGQCVELCGDKHGNMVISAVVVERDEFDRYITLLRHRDDTVKVWNVLQPAKGGAVDEAALAKAVAAYLDKGSSPERQYALSYWMASNYAALLRALPPKGSSIAALVGIENPAADRQARGKQYEEATRAKRKLVDDRLPALAKPLAAILPAAADNLLR
jgi:cytochrome c oxidase subunit II